HLNSTEGEHQRLQEILLAGSVPLTRLSNSVETPSDLASLESLQAGLVCNEFLLIPSPVAVIRAFNKFYASFIRQIAVQVLTFSDRDSLFQILGDFEKRDLQRYQRLAKFLPDFLRNACESVFDGICATLSPPSLETEVEHSVLLSRFPVLRVLSELYLHPEDVELFDALQKHVLPQHLMYVAQLALFFHHPEVAGELIEVLPEDMESSDALSLHAKQKLGLLRYFLGLIDGFPDDALVEADAPSFFLQVFDFTERTGMREKGACLFDHFRHQNLLPPEWNSYRYQLEIRNGSMQPFIDVVNSRDDLPVAAGSLPFLVFEVSRRRDALRFYRGELTAEEKDLLGELREVMLSTASPDLSVQERMFRLLAVFFLDLALSREVAEDDDSVCGLPEDEYLHVRIQQAMMQALQGDLQAGQRLLPVLEPHYDRILMQPMLIRYAVFVLALHPSTRIQAKKMWEDWYHKSREEACRPLFFNFLIAQLLDLEIAADLEHRARFFDYPEYSDRAYLKKWVYDLCNLK
ncbi:MAG: hypothetical protein D6820_15045, partial [Lentisphaerae bacterium]